MNYPDISSSTYELANAINEFGVHLYQTIKETRDGENMFFSPLSISTAMAMTQLGARGDTAKQIAEVFRFNKIDGGKLHQIFKGIDDTLFRNYRYPYGESRIAYTPSGYRFLVSANKLYGKSGFPFVQSFLDDTARSYDSGIEAVDDFSSPAVIKSINDWVSERTDGKISSFLEPGALDSLTRLILVNAIYFKAKWIEKFSPRFTVKDLFKIRGSRETTIPVDFMTSKGHKAVTVDKNNRCTVLCKSFEQVHGSMLIVLPDEDNGLPELESKLSTELIQGWADQLNLREVDVFLPKFKVTEQLDLKDVLQSMGVTDAFDGKRADFSGITGARNLELSALVHKTFVEIDEEGCEAAAVSIVRQICVTCPGFESEIPIVFRADHPFLFIILHHPTKSILFIGRFVDPRSSTTNASQGVE